MPSSANRAKLYQNSLELFYKKGFKATTMRDIAESMNFEAASLYNYIDSKHALLEQLLFEVADKFLDGIVYIKAGKRSNIEKIQSVIGLYVKITSDNPYMAALLTSEWRNLKDNQRKRFLEHRETYEEHLRSLLAEYYQEQDQQHIDVDVALHTFLGATRWIYNWYITQTEIVDPHRLEEQLTNLILYGLAHPSS